VHDRGDRKREKQKEYNRDVLYQMQCWTPKHCSEFARKSRETRKEGEQIGTRTVEKAWLTSHDVFKQKTGGWQPVGKSPTAEAKPEKRKVILQRKSPILVG